MNIQFESIVCPICGSKKYSAEFSSRDQRYGAGSDLKFNIVKCKICNFKFLNPRPKEESIGLFYKMDFHKPGRGFAYSIIRPFFNFVQNEIIRKVKSYIKEGRVLDIGCGNGQLVSLLADTGYSVYGVEPSSEAVNFFPVNVRSRIFNKNINECGFEDNSFDCVLMFQSLEHVHNLEKIFSNIRKILKPEGMLWISVPNDDFFESKLFGAYYYNLEVPRHLYFFTKKSLQAILEKEGFKNIEVNKNHFWELFCTPASFYFGLKYFLSDKAVPVKYSLLSMLYAPLILLRFIFRIIFLRNNQNLNIICKLNKTI